MPNSKSSPTSLSKCVDIRFLEMALLSIKSTAKIVRFLKSFLLPAHNAIVPNA